MKRKIIFIAALLPFLLAHSALGGMKGPPGHQKQTRTPAPEVTSLPSWAGMQAVRFFSTFISPIDGPRSPSYPTGSAYGLIAIREKGLILGSILTADRLFHETDRPLGPLIHIHGKTRFYDPLENNTFWWDDSAQTKKP